MTLDRLLAQATAHHAAGRLREAETGYRKVLSRQPGHPYALHLLGVVALQVGKAQVAVDLIRRAIDRLGTVPVFHVNLGQALKALGDRGQAAQCFERAIALAPNLADARHHLGRLHMEDGRPADAVSCYRHALTLQPDNAELRNSLAIALHALGRLDEARAALELAVALKPDDAAAHNNLGAVLLAQGDAAAARGMLERALALDPGHADAHANLGTSLKRLGLSADAVACYDRAIALAPGVANFHNRRGVALADAGQPQAAAEAYGRALALAPDFVDALNNLGNVRIAQGRLGDAVAAYRRATTADAGHAVAWNNLGMALTRAGMAREAVAAHERAIALEPGHAAAWRSRLVARPYDPDAAAADLVAEARAFAARFLAPAGRSAVWRNGPDPDRSLRIGYVSADLGRHPVGYFLLAALTHRARNEAAAFCYSSRRQTDDLTARLRGEADEWRDVAGLGDGDVAALIRADRIDILIDLSGHSTDNRLALFARRAAPVQATWIGFPLTTGVAAMDWIIADPVLAPPGSEGEFGERVARLPDVAWCWTPPEYAPAVASAPCLSEGHVTFGSVSAPAKLSEGALAAWAAILRDVPDARLLLQYRDLDDPFVRGRVAAIMEQAGVAPGRLVFAGWTPHRQALAAYGGIDIALDPFPFAGGTTTCEALWMGVPVISRHGATMAGRAGATLLRAAGLGELVATDETDYVARAVALARDRDRLAALRGSLRAKLAASPVCDGPRFARAFGALLRDMWRDWCEKQRAPSRSDRQ